MNTTAKLGIVLLLAGIMSPSVGEGVAAPATPDDPLYAHTAAGILGRDFSAPEISYLLMELPAAAVVAERWDGGEQAVPVGSLVKPFTAVAFAETHHFRFPEYTCAAGSCWLPRGHGRLGIVRATALSCNAYFTTLAQQLSAAEVNSSARHFGLNGPGANARAEGLIGMHGVWRESPRSIARAYAELLGRRMQPGIREIVEGMSSAASNGTAAALSQAVPYLPLLAKTGTAPCTHEHRAPGDGFTIVAWPADAPRYLLLVRQHGVPGAQSAALAARMLRALEPRS